MKITDINNLLEKSGPEYWKGVHSEMTSIMEVSTTIAGIIPGLDQYVKFQTEVFKTMEVGIDINQRYVNRLATEGEYVDKAWAKAGDPGSVFNKNIYNTNLHGLDVLKDTNISN